MKILVTNDDGIEDKGLKKLVKALVEMQPIPDSSGTEIYVAAPGEDGTGCGGAVTFGKLIEVRKHPLGLGEKKSWAVTGTPADCVLLALEELVGEVDLVLSGINNEPNIGDDIRFSGTIGACREASFAGVNAIGLSLAYSEGQNYYQPVIAFIQNLLQEKNIKNKKEEKLAPIPRALKPEQLSPAIYLNINFPNSPLQEIKGIKYVKLGRRRYRDCFHLEKEDPYPQYRLHGTMIEEEQPHTDSEAVKNNYIAVTPLNRDNTDYEVLKQLQNE